MLSALQVSLAERGLRVQAWVSKEVLLYVFAVHERSGGGNLAREKSVDVVRDGMRERAEYASEYARRAANAKASMAWVC